MLQCVRAFTFEKTISTSTTKYKCRCELGKTKKELGNTIKRTFAHANSYNFAAKHHFKVFRLSFSETIPIFFLFALKNDLSMSDRYNVFTTD